MRYKLLYLILFILIIFDCKTNKDLIEKESSENNEEIVTNDEKVTEDETKKKSNKKEKKNTKNKEKNSNNLSKIKIEKEFYVNVIFTQNVKVNDKIVIYDMTDDVKKYLTFYKKYDNTNDLLNSGDFLYKKEDLERLEKHKNIIKNSLIENIRKEITNKSESLAVSEYNENSDNTKYVITLLIDKFQEGEYNLIKNLPTEIVIKANIFNENNMKTEVHLMKKKYKQKAEIDYPIERKRLEVISNNISKDIFKIIYNKYIK